MSTANIAVAVNVVQTVTNAAVNTIAVYNEVHEPVISAAQGPQGVPGVSGATNISGLVDVDLVALKDGSLLIYNETSNTWKAQTTLDKQALECGQY